MKVNKVLLLKVLGSSFNHNKSLVEAFLYLHRFNLITGDDHAKINAILKEDGSFRKVLIYLKIKKEIIEFIVFFNNYYSLNDSINLSLKLVEERDNLKKDLITSLIYPTILIIFSTIAIYFVSSSIVPQLFILSETQDLTYNIIVQILKYFPMLMLFFIIVIISFIIVALVLLKKDFSKHLSFFMKIKFINNIIKLIASMTFALYFKEVVKSIPLSKNCMDVLQKQSNNVFIHYMTSFFINELEKGVHIFDLISKTEYLSNDLKHTILIAKNSTNMAALLEDYYVVKMSILKRNAKSFIAIFVPVVISVVGVVLILMYLLIMLPIINMSTNI